MRRFVVVVPIILTDPRSYPLLLLLFSFIFIIFIGLLIGLLLGLPGIFDI